MEEPSHEGKFEIILDGMTFKKGEPVKEHYRVVHAVPDIQIGHNTVIDGKVAERVPTPVMANTQTGEVYMLGDVHDRPGEPFSPTGYIFPFDERCFVDNRGIVHAAAGFGGAIVDMIRKIEQQKEPASSIVMSREILRVLESNHETRPIVERMFHGEHSSVSHITVGVDPGSGATSALAHVMVAC